MKFYLFRPGALMAVLAMGLLAGSQAEASDVWTGSLIGFTNLSGSDPNLEINQDRMTTDVWLTRSSTRGIYNAALEGGFIDFASPANTEWALGSLANFDSLSYTDWEHLFGGAMGGGPPALLGQDTVMHVISSDTYLSIQLTFWGGSGGGFSYLRSTPVPEPAVASIMFSGLAVAAGARYYFRRARRRTGQ